MRTMSICLRGALVSDKSTFNYGFLEYARTCMVHGTSGSRNVDRLSRHPYQYLAHPHPHSPPRGYTFVKHLGLRNYLSIPSSSNINFYIYFIFIHILFKIYLFCACLFSTINAAFISFGSQWALSQPCPLGKYRNRIILWPSRSWEILGDNGIFLLSMEFILKS